MCGGVGDVVADVGVADSAGGDVRSSGVDGGGGGCGGVVWRRRGCWRRRLWC